MDADAIIEAVGQIMRERFADIERLIAGARIKAIEDAGPGRVLVVLGDGTTFPFTVAAGPRGDKGDPGSNGANGRDGVDGANGRDGKDGERGAEGVGIERVEESGDTFSLVMSNGVEVEVQKAPGTKGERGERGERGEPGADRMVIAPRHVRDGDAVAKGELVYFAGGLMQATRETMRDPANDAASYVPIVNGIDAIRIVENPATRTYDITARLTNGAEVVERIPGPPKFLADGPRDGERIIRGDQFVRGDWLYTATEDDADPANTVPGADGEHAPADGWRRQFARGKRGPRGEDGKRGPPGPGIADVEVVDGVLVVKMTSGEEKFFPIIAAGMAA